MADSNSKSGSSPEATGGAGTIDEYRFGAVNLVKLLRGDPLPGLTAPLAAVGLQRREAGNTLDDVVLQSQLDPKDFRIEYQVKRTMSPTRTNAAFLDALMQCLESLEDRADDIESGRLRLGLAASGPVNPLVEVQKLTDLARAHATWESFEAIALKSGVTNKSIRARFNCVLDAIVVAQIRRGRLLEKCDFQELTLRFLKVTYIWQFEVAPDGRDTLEAVSRLADILPSDDLSASTVFSRLVEIAQTWGPKAGLISQGMLRAELERLRVFLTVEPKQREGLARLERSTRQELNATTWKIADRLELPRLAARQQIKDAITSNSLVVLHGAAGAGKSVLARRFVNELGQQATKVIINLTGRGRDTLADLQAELGADLATTLPAAATTGLRILLIDGAEHALVDNARLLKAVLRAVPTDSIQGPPWKVLLTVRSEAVAAVIRHLQEAPLQIALGDADDDEVTTMIELFPRLAPLTRHRRSIRLLRRPYLVDLLVRADAELGDRALGEEDVMVHVWDEVIRLGEGSRPGLGSAHDRAHVCLALAQEVIRSATGSTLGTASGQAVQGLVSDDVLTRDRTRYRFAHDVLLDYTVAMRLFDEDRRQLLAGASDVRRLLRAVRLMLQRTFSDVGDQSAADVVSVWTEATRFAAELSGQDGPRWLDIPYEALLAMGDPRPLMETLQPILLSQDGAQLKRLLAVTMRAAVVLQREPGTEQLRLNLVLAAPVVNFLSAIAESVPQRITHTAVDLVHRWLLAAWSTQVPVSDHLVEPAQLNRAIALWSQTDTYGDRLKTVLAGLSFLSGYNTPEANAVFDRLIDRSYELAAVVEEPETAAAMAAHNPDLLLRLAGMYYLDQSLTLDPAETPPGKAGRRGRRRRSGLSLSTLEDHDDGVRGHTATFLKVPSRGLAAPHYGPFAVLLACSPVHGLRLVGTVVDAASAARTALERSFSHDDPNRTVTIMRPGWPGPNTYSGPLAAWRWFRCTSNGPYTVMSATMALAEWALQETMQRPLSAVLDQVLGTSTSLAVVAVAVSLTIERLDIVADELDVFLNQPVVWDLESARIATESSGLAHPLKGYSELGSGLEPALARLVLRSNTERRAVLRSLGDQLLQLSHQHLAEDLGAQLDDDHPMLLVARRRAQGFDAAAYLVERSAASEQTVEVSVVYPEGLQQKLEQSGGARAKLNLQVRATTDQAIAVRDGEGRHDPVGLLHTLQDTVRQLDDLGGSEQGIYTFRDAFAAVASALAAAAVRDRLSINDNLLLEAVAQLVVVAEEGLLEDETTAPIRGTYWFQGAARSAATILPLVAADAATMARCESLGDRVESAIITLASSRSAEVRQRLVQALHSGLVSSCTLNPEGTKLHQLALRALKELVLNSGRTARQDGLSNHERLTEPLADALGAGSNILNVGEAADALPGLVKLASLWCAHGPEATALLRLLIDYDLAAWPERFARWYNEDLDRWRADLDQYVAGCILAGDQAILDQYLSAFASVGEDLRGLLLQLAAQATTPEQASVLLGSAWPQILDRLLPASRDLRSNGHREQPNRDHENELDRALLPAPPADAPWSPTALTRVLARWVEAYTDRPHVADHAIMRVANYGLIGSPAGTAIVLQVLGARITSIMEYSRLIPTWLRIVLIEQKGASKGHRPELMSLLDQLAAAGSTGAVELQLELELQ